ncbi:MAG TPA: hypothetical protein VJ246_02565, partial [Patescibacteria group bacterium]|nr:hypothetical protein [Patescibacteria group bacterium]
MTFQDFCSRLEKIEATTLRLEMTKHLAELFRDLHEGEIEAACWLLLGRLAPLYENIEFHFAEKMMMRALAHVADKKRLTHEVLKDAHQLGLLGSDGSNELSSVKSLFKQFGDLGNVAEKLITSHEQDRRNVAEVYDELHALAVESG